MSTSTSLFLSIPDNQNSGFIPTLSSMSNPSGPQRGKHIVSTILASLRSHQEKSCDEAERMTALTIGVRTKCKKGSLLA